MPLGQTVAGSREQRVRIRNACHIAVLLLLTFAVAVHAEPITLGEITVVDGDTIDARGARFRMVGYDTPEVSTPRRKVGAAERALALRAKERFIELLRVGVLDLTEVRCSCTDTKIEEGKCNAGRKCGIFTVNGENIGKTLIAEGLAVEFVCRPTSCPAMPDWPKIIEQRP
jgi:endonuclease YncB( thermonuclease family)